MSVESIDSTCIMYLSQQLDDLQVDVHTHCIQIDKYIVG